MDFKVNREIIGTNEVVCDSVQEQSVELDYILPDYYPDIFKLIKCQLNPKIMGCSLNGDKVEYDLVVGIKIIYCGENGKGLHCIDQKMSYSKTVELSRVCDRPIVNLTTKSDYANCRVVNQRRIDLRGAISTKIRAICNQKQEIVSDAYGMNIQLKKVPVTYAANKLYTSKRVTISEEFDLGFSKPAIRQIIRSDGVVTSSDKKVIANKMITKGDVQINLLYTCEGDDDMLETMQLSMPFSQIIEMEGVDESYESMVEAEVVSCDIISKENGDGDCKLIDCEILILIECTAIKNNTTNIVMDAYSTKYPCNFEVKNAKIEKCPVMLNDTAMVKATVDYKDGDIKNVFDVWCKVKNITSRFNYENNKIMVMGTINYCVMCCNNNGMPVLMEVDQPFEHYFTVEKLKEGTIFEPSAKIMSCSYSLSSVSCVEVKAEMRVCGKMYETSNCTVVADIMVDEEKPKENNENYAVKLYYADEGEEVWEIAKRYSTSVEAIIEENDCSNKIVERSMILIPIID